MTIYLKIVGKRWYVTSKVYPWYVTNRVNNFNFPSYGYDMMWYTVPGTSYFLPVPGEFLSDKNTTRNLTAAAKHMSSRSNLLLYMEAIPANNEYEPTIANGNWGTIVQHSVDGLDGDGI